MVEHLQQPDLLLGSEQGQELFQVTAYLVLVYSSSAMGLWLRRVEWGEQRLGLAVVRVQEEFSLALAQQRQPSWSVTPEPAKKTE